MASPYSSTSVSGYNANPPPDDGTTVGTNLITWAGVKSKIGDPLNTFASAVNSALVTAFGKTISGASVVSTGSNYPAGAADQGRLIRATAGGVVITTPDATSVGTPFVFAVVNNAASGASVAGFGGTQTIDGNLSVSLAAGAGMVLFSDGSNWFSAGEPGTAQPVGSPQGRLTLVSGTPVLIADQVAATAVLYTPYIGNQIPIPNGTLFVNNTFSELTLTLNNTNYLANTIYDVYIFLDPGDNATVRIGSSPAWSTSTAGSGARGTGAGTAELQRLNGMLTNKNAMTMRNNVTTYSVIAKGGTYVGSIFIDGTNGQVTCHISAGQSRKFGVWNVYNRRPIVLTVFDSTASWTYASATIRQSNNAAGNKATVFSGLAEEWFQNIFTQEADVTSGEVEVGIGYNVTNAVSGTQGTTGIISGTVDSTMTAQYTAPPSLGVNNVNCTESVLSANTQTFAGSQRAMVMTSSWNG